MRVVNFIASKFSNLNPCSIHQDQGSTFALVHTGIIENCHTLRAMLTKIGSDRGPKVLQNPQDERTADALS